MKGSGVYIFSFLGDNQEADQVAEIEEMEAHDMITEIEIEEDQEVVQVLDKIEEVTEMTEVTVTEREDPDLTPERGDQQAEALTETAETRAEETRTTRNKTVGAPLPGKM